MKFTPALFAHAEAALAALLRFEYPADAVLSHYFREHRQLGHADRGFVAETCFAVLRRLRSLSARCDGDASPRRLLLAALFCLRGWNLRELAPVTREAETAWLAAAKAAKGEEWPAAVRCDLPDWLYERLQAQFGADTEALAMALNRPAPLDLRVNPLQTTREAVLARLAADDIAAEACAYSPLGIRLEEKPALAKHPLFVAGDIEVQDEGSQLLGFLVAPKRGEMVADFCAGAGGKTLLLGALMRSSGRLYAFDVAEKRLANLKPRLARSGLSNVHPVRIESESDAKVKRLAGKLDRVLVDAPCSGLGTLRRNPDLKWRQSPQSVAELVAKQGAILAAAARLVKPGGRLVYATCSLLAEENDGVVQAFLAAHPDFVPLPAAEILAKQGVAGIAPAAGEALRLSPQAHGSDGFFALAMERR
ncbi:RsmB/NOP family class I SAM-dependent RNA methyltransferase [Azospira restricta]|uniref:RsmB/NOP family class I SAM-dependent RNA methyltransferase n=1 Tax=Azospira restricta TaxID=404405 RepID=A0A974SNI6_9RHOO|nr:RsmB/NOP family class I SAM-dependent RNA methyltransferase [Azospira restricta]QRJ63534.1 RsmB/NOP family class I SAM-dependent RNA methyltransferase [Azospira restricta]